MTVRTLYVALVCAFIITAVQRLTSQAPASAPTSSGPAVSLKGKLERIKVHGKSLEGNLLGETPAPEVSIYLPPSYSTDRSRRYPVVYLLHGYTNTDLGYFGPEGRALHLIAERVFASGAAREMILVMPNAMNAFGGSMYSNSVTAGNWEGYVAEDLVAYMDKNFFVPMTDQQWVPHNENREIVARIVQKWHRYHFLSEADQLRGPFPLGGEGHQEAADLRV